MPAITHRARPSDPIQSILSGAVAEVEEGFSLLDVATELAADEIGAVLVRSPHGVVGLLSERDLVTVVASGADLAEVSAADAMSTDLIWTHPLTSIRDAGVLMRDAGIRHLPVGDHREAIGVVSARDVLAVMLANSG
jgi:CBS domain-containing protein